MEYRARPFRPAWWLPTGHAQTIGGKLVRPRVDVPLARERMETPDGDFVELDLAAEPRPGAPIGLVLHGLEGSARRRYMLLTYRELARQGVRAIGLNFRSCGGEPNRLPRFYHSGDTEDLAFVLGALRRRFPGRSLGAVGFSLGGNVLLKYLGERGDAPDMPLSAAAAVSVPFDLAAGAEALERGLGSRIYNAYFLRSLRRKARLKAELLSGACDVEALHRARTLRQFDEAATAPIHGFRDAADYYRRSSSGPFLGAVRVPTLLIHSLDDPFLPAEALPRRAAEENPYITAVFTERGGHVGFVEGGPLSPRFWAESEAARFLSARLEEAGG